MQHNRCAAKEHAMVRGCISLDVSCCSTQSGSRPAAGQSAEHDEFARGSDVKLNLDEAAVCRTMQEDGTATFQPLKSLLLNEGAGVVHRQHSAPHTAVIRSAANC